MSVYGYVAILILVIEITVFAVYGIDKLKAKNGSFRIPEATLIAAAFIGPAGALLGMYIWHHKTRKPKFFITVPLFLIMRIALVVFIFYKIRIK
jgi:hypothetical protein